MNFLFEFSFCATANFQVFYFSIVVKVIDVVMWSKARKGKKSCNISRCSSLEMSHFINLPPPLTLSIFLFLDSISNYMNARRYRRKQSLIVGLRAQVFRVSSSRQTSSTTSNETKVSQEKIVHCFQQDEVKRG